jgi:hypothetical protein
MRTAHGERLLGLLRETERTSDWHCVATRKGSAEFWMVSGLTWTVELHVDPLNWIGLSFESTGSGGPVTYDLDTDLYKLTDERNDAFVEKIELGIVEILNNLRRRLVLRGMDGSKPFLLFPLDGQYVRVVKGRFATTATTRDTIEPDVVDRCVAIA